MRPIRRGFTLIELMIAVAVIGLLAAVALPAYKDYTVRSKVSELILAASAYKTSIVEKATNDGTLASAGAGLSVVVSGRVSSGVITAAGHIHVSGSSTSVGVAIQIDLIPSLNASGVVVWRCRMLSGAATFKYVPPECRNLI